MRIMILLCLVPTLLLAQTYLEANGRTVAFTLTTGAKAGWFNTGTSVQKSSLVQPMSAFRVSVSGNGLRVQTGVKGTIKLFDVRGRMMFSVPVMQDGFLALPHGLTNGIYVARFDAPGISSKTARLAVVR